MAKRKNTKKARQARAQSFKWAILCLALAGIALLFFSGLSFNIGDWPSDYVWPHNEPTQNWCGRVGAFCAYYMLYYVGPGAFVALISAGGLIIAKLSGREITQPVFRVIGAGLLTVAASATFYCFWPDGIYEFPHGSGGILGVAAAEFLNAHFAVLGMAILIGATWVVGLVLLADSLVVAVLVGIGHTLQRVVGLGKPTLDAAKQQSEVLGEIWRKLSLKQKPQQQMRIGRTRKPDASDDEQVEQHLNGEDVQEEAQPEPEQVEEVEEDTRSATERAIDAITVTAQQRKEPKKEYVPPSYEDYTLPPMDLLAEPEYGYMESQEQIVKEKAQILEGLLGEFNVNARVVAADTGPVVTMYELELAAGVKVSQINNLANDMARALGAGSVRVVAPLRGRHTIGIEVPNSEKEKVRIKDLMRLAPKKPAETAIPLYLGKDSAGDALVSDLTKMPHLLIAGTTGSGKSVCINSIICSVLLTRRPDEVKTILVDPKMVEMAAFNNIPHLMCPIVTETQRAMQILEWATVKMDERYALLAEARVKNIADYNKLGWEEIKERFEPSNEEEEAKIPKRLAYIMIVIDELADLMMVAGKEIESYIVRLAQKSRAVGIHLIIATQRPQATVVTGLIKSNLPTRIGFRVAARMDSRIVLDQNGAETLLGEGDMLFLKPGTSDLVRAQGTFMDDGEIRRIVKHLKEVAEPQYHPELVQLNRFDASSMERDDLFEDAVEVVLETRRGSVSLLQRRLSVGYARASRIIEMMAAAGILGEYKGSQAREVLMTKAQWEQAKKDAMLDREQGYAYAQDDDKSEPGVSEGQRAHMALDDEDEEIE